MKFAILFWVAMVSSVSALAESEDIRTATRISNALVAPQVQKIIVENEGKLGAFLGMEYGGMGEASFGPVYLNLRYWENVPNPNWSEENDIRTLRRYCKNKIDFNLTTREYERSFITTQCQYADGTKAPNPIESEELARTTDNNK